jgi:DnaJ like chaperone protein
MNIKGSNGKLTGALIGGFFGLLMIGKVGIWGLAFFVWLGSWWGGQFDRSSTGTGGRRGFGGASTAVRQKAFFESIFIAMGRLAKADGHVSEEEIQITRSIMHQWGLGPEDVLVAIELFNRGKQADFPIDQQIAKFVAVCGGQRDLVRHFMEVLMQIPLLKGGINPAERELLSRIASGLGIGRVELAQLEAILRAQHSFRQGAGQTRSPQADLAEAYKALGIEASATDKEVKTAYRRLMNQHHPDKLASKGLPESMLEVAKEKTHEIRAAYEQIRDHRGFK